MNQQKAVKFLIISYLIAGLVAAFLHFTGIYYTNKMLAMILVAVLYMPAPAYAVLILEKGNFRKIAQDYGIGWKGINWKTIVFYVIGAVAFLPCILLLLTYFLGNFLGIEAVGTVAMSSAEIKDGLTALIGAEEAAKANIPLENWPPVLVLLPLGILSALGAGFTINAIFGLGEELGWRGYLYDAWQNMGFVKMNIATGIVWGLWHAPIILMGHNYPKNPYLGILMMVVVCIGLSFIMADSRRKSGSVLAPAMLHGAFNALAGTMVALIVNMDMLFGNVTGALCMLAAILTYIAMNQLIKEPLKE